MKVEKIKDISYYYGIGKPCCKKMKKYLNNEYVMEMDLNGDINIGYSYKDCAKIEYCPFCGEKIEYES